MNADWTAFISDTFHYIFLLNKKKMLKNVENEVVTKLIQKKC